MIGGFRHKGLEEIHRTGKTRRIGAGHTVHPGEIIKEDILPSAGLSVTAAAKSLGVSRQMLHDILAERKPLSVVMCLKLSRLFGGSPEVWMRLQAAYDLKIAEQDRKVMERVARIVPLKPAGEAPAWR